MGSDSDDETCESDNLATPHRGANLPRDAMEEDADGVATVPVLIDLTQEVAGLCQLVPGALLQANQAMGATTVRNQVGATFIQNSLLHENENPAKMPLS